jgi:hypothetical protein
MGTTRSASMHTDVDVDGPEDRARMSTIRSVIGHSAAPSLADLPAAVEGSTTDTVLRWHVADVRDDGYEVELTTVRERFPHLESTAAAAAGRSALVSIVPTGIGCDVGGYAGDAGPATQLLAKTVDHLLVNPNAVNASDFAALPDNLLYTEGAVLDLFCQGRVDLGIPAGNKIGLVVDRREAWAVRHAVNVAGAVHAVHGVDIVDVVVTERPLGTRCVRLPSGAYSGVVDDVPALYDACERLLAAGADAIAIASSVQDLPADDYDSHFDGRHPNPVGGAEAVLSHLVCRRFGVPSAHAPLINDQGPQGGSAVVDARSAGEAVSANGLACVLMGLRRAPRFHGAAARQVLDAVSFSDVLAVVAPASALGGIPVIAAAAAGVPVIAVEESTILDVSADRFGLSGVIPARNYIEAAGVALALRHGLSVDSLVRPLRVPAVFSALDDIRADVL